MPDFIWETRAAAAGFRAVCGIDEAGRGSLAGPVCAAAVVLPAGFDVAGVDDSKKLSAKKREALYGPITRAAVCYAVAFSDVAEIEALNILNATFLAMRRAVLALDPPADYALIDGNRLPADFPLPCEAVVHGDGRSVSIAAASVLAKVSRDRLMRDLAARYPGYGFEQNMGYGTAAHVAAIRALGPCEAHRGSFLGKIR